MNITIRDVDHADLGRIIEIERASFSDPWTRGMFGSYLVAGDSNAFLAAVGESGTVVGYAITQTVADEAELLNIAVDPEHRHRGIGALLLDAAMERSSRAGASEMWLEVRASNSGARTLYDARGFAAMGVRKRYYHAPREDAIVLRAPLRTTSLTTSRTESVTQAVLGFSAGPMHSIHSSATPITRQETK